MMAIRCGVRPVIILQTSKIESCNFINDIIVGLDSHKRRL
jgi:hypothetical protein